MTPLVTAILVVTIGALYYYFTRTFDYWNKRNVPGPEPVPFFGNIMHAALRNIHMSVIMKQIYGSYPTEKVVGIFRMTTPCLLIRDLDIVKHVTVKDFDNFVDRGIEFSKGGLGATLYHSDGDSWRLLKHNYSSMFTNQKLKNMMHLLHDRTDKFVDYVSELVAKSPEHDIYVLMKKYTLSTIMACVFGLDVDAFTGDVTSLMKIGQSIFSLNFLFELDMMYPGILKKMNTSFFPKYLTKFFKDTVDTAITQRNGLPSARRDCMDLMIEIRNKKLEALKSLGDEDSKSEEITNWAIEAQVFTFFAAGFETTSSTMLFMLYQLALEPSVQDRLRSEIDDYLGKHGGRIELETLKELTYLEQVLNETLRMYPIEDTLIRKAQNDYECPGTNVKVVKGQTVLISVLAIHYDETYYPEPEKFNPENFAPEYIARRHSCAFLPFGLGPRRCIGLRFAEVQLRLCLIRLLSKFRVEASENTPRSVSFDPYRVSLAPNKNIYVNLYPRD